MSSIAWALALTLQALPPCKLPDLDQSHPSTSAFEVRPLANGDLAVAMTDPVADGEPMLSATPDSAAPADGRTSASVWLWSEASDWLLVPAGFAVDVAAVGVNGGWVIEMHDPKAPDQRRFRASSTGACVGCAYGAGAAYLEAYATAARDNEFLYCEGLERPIVRDDAGPEHLRFHFDNPRGARHDAIVVIGGEDIGYRELVVSGLDESLRDPIIAAFADD